jgi:chemotaxis protein histidine kinase CheA
LLTDEGKKKITDPIYPQDEDGNDREPEPLGTLVRRHLGSRTIRHDGTVKVTELASGTATRYGRVSRLVFDAGFSSSDPLWRRLTSELVDDPDFYPLFRKGEAVTRKTVEARVKLVDAVAIERAKAAEEAAAAEAQAAAEAAAEEARKAAEEAAKTPEERAAAEAAAAQEAADLAAEQALAGEPATDAATDAATGEPATGEPATPTPTPTPTPEPTRAAQTPVAPEPVGNAARLDRIVVLLRECTPPDADDCAALHGIRAEVTRLLSSATPEDRAAGKATAERVHRQTRGNIS